MTWYAGLTDIAAVLDAADAAAQQRLWQAFRSKVATEPAPYHLQDVVAALDRHRGRRPRGEVRILDHGCGPGSSLIWLAAMGFTDIVGCDVGGDDDSGGLDRQNRWTRTALGHREPRFHVHDGWRLPLADRSVDFVLSQQVLEHVPDDQFEAYYAEEARVLVPGGVAFHQVPHRLVPYDSHTGTWLLHMLPHRVAAPAMRLAGSPWPEHLHLRWPWRHLDALDRHIGAYENLSRQRLVRANPFDYYDGPRSIRRMMTRACRLPAIGPLVAQVLAGFVLLETVTVRRND